MPGIFDFEKQLAFYGAYHSNKINIAIHMVFVPIIMWTAFVMIYPLDLPSAIPAYTYEINKYFIFKVNFTSLVAALYMGYYFILEPVAAALYLPQMTFTLLTATAFARGHDNMPKAVVLHVIAWIFQFIGHGFAEKRAPALLDNLVGAIVLAPFFVHLELLFAAGYSPEAHQRVKNAIGLEIAKIRKIEGDKKRAAEGKKH